MTNKNDPWGRDQGPPDLMALIKKWFGSSTTPNPSSLQRYFLMAALGVLALWVLAGIFVVSPPEQAVVLRFGKYVETLGPGPHWIAPIIQSRTILNVQEVSNFPYQSEMLTQDENIVSVAVAVQYRIADPQKYLFAAVGPIETLQQATSSALRQAVGQMSLDAILTTGRQQLRDQVITQLNKILALYGTGLEVTDVTLQPAKPPEAVTAAFDDAISAREDEQRYINKAQAYARQKLSLAKGQIARVQQSAVAYKREAVLKAEGDVARFLALLKPYEEAPQVTRDRLYIDAITNMLRNTRNILLDSAGNNVLYLPLPASIPMPRDKPVVLNGENNALPQPNKTDTPADNLDSSYTTVTRPTYLDEGAAP